MTFRHRLITLTTVTVFVALALGSLATFVAVRAFLLSEVDDSLHKRASALLSTVSTIASSTSATATPLPPDAIAIDTATLLQLQGSGWLLQVITKDGQTGTQGGPPTDLPVSSEDHAIAAGTRGERTFDASIGGVNYRILTTPTTTGAIQVARPLTENEDLLRHLNLVLVAVALTGGTLAALASVLIAKAQAAPVDKLTKLAEEVARTHDTTQRIEVATDDELGRLASAFNEMLAALHTSIARQRRLVADVSHELRTPLTSVRTNVEVLARANELPPEEAQVVRQAILSQIDELAAMVGDLTEQGRDDAVRQPPTRVMLDEITATEVHRSRAAHPSAQYTLSAVPTPVNCSAEQLQRAIRNLLDNAATWNPEGATIEVVVDPTGLTVRDHGPGIADQDLPHVFDPYYRSETARGKPGTGLGLAIVHDIVNRHGWTVTVDPAPDGGTLAAIRIPKTTTPEQPSPLPTPDPT
jgi:two-component system, OmpR family, sensor histidine kinase MprB